MSRPLQQQQLTRFSLWFVHLHQGVLLAFLVSANQVDVFVARQQRKQLGLCPQCGGLYEASSCVEKGCPMVSAAAKAQEQKPEQQRPPGGG